MPNASSVMRLSRYKNALMKLKALNFVRVFSDNLGDAAGVTATQVRKDFSSFGITGNRRGGYKVEELMDQLNSILGKDKIHEVVVVGVGNIGRALLRYKGFELSGLKLGAGFEIDSSKQGNLNGIEIYGLEKLHEYVAEHGVKFGIIAVPEFAAQQVFEVMTAAGIRGVLNFAPSRLKSTDDCVVRNIHLISELESIIYFVTVNERTMV